MDRRPLHYGVQAEGSRTHTRNGFLCCLAVPWRHRYLALSGSGICPLAAAVFVLVDLAAEERAAGGAEHGAEQLVTVAGDFVAG